MEATNMDLETSHKMAEMYHLMNETELQSCQTLAAENFSKKLNAVEPCHPQYANNMKVEKDLNTCHFDYTLQLEAKNNEIKAKTDEAILLRMTAKSLADALQAKEEELHHLHKEYKNKLMSRDKDILAYQKSAEIIARKYEAKDREYKDKKNELQSCQRILTEYATALKKNKYKVLPKLENSLDCCKNIGEKLIAKQSAEDKELKFGQSNTTQQLDNGLKSCQNNTEHKLLKELGTCKKALENYEFQLGSSNKALEAEKQKLNTAENLNCQLEAKSEELETKKKELQTCLEIAENCIYQLKATNRELKAEEENFKTCHLKNALYEFEVKKKELKNEGKETKNCPKKAQDLFSILEAETKEFIAKKRKLEMFKMTLENCNSHQLQAKNKKLEAKEKGLEGKEEELKDCRQSLCNLTNQLEITTKNFKAKQTELEFHQRTDKSIASQLEAKSEELKAKVKELEICHKTADYLAGALNTKATELENFKIEHASKSTAKNEDYEVLQKTAQYMLEKKDKDLELKDKEIEALKNSLENKSKEFKSIERKLEYCQSLADNISNELQDKQKQLESYHAKQMMDKERELESCQNTAEKYKHDLEDKNNQLLVKMEELKSYKDNLEELNAKLHGKNEALKMAESTLEYCQSTANKIDNELNDKLESNQKYYVDLLMDREKYIESTLRELKVKDKDLEYSHMFAEKVVKELKDKEEQLKSCGTEYASKLQSKENEMETYKRNASNSSLHSDELETYKQALEKCNSELQMKNGLLKRIETKLEFCQNTADRMKDELKDKQKELNSCHKEYNDILTTKEKDLEACKNAAEILACDSEARNSELKSRDKEVHSNLKYAKILANKLKNTEEELKSCQMEYTSKLEAKQVEIESYKLNATQWSLSSKKELESYNNAMRKCSSELQGKDELLEIVQKKLEHFQNITDQINTGLNNKQKELESSYKDYSDKLMAKQEELQKAAEMHAHSLEDMNNEIMTKDRELQHCQTSANKLEKKLKCTEKQLESYKKEMDLKLQEIEDNMNTCEDKYSQLHLLFISKEQDLLDGKAKYEHIDSHYTGCESLKDELKSERKEKEDIEEQLSVLKNINEMQLSETARVKKEIDALKSCLKTAYQSKPYPEVLTKTKQTIIQSLREKETSPEEHISKPNSVDILHTNNTASRLQGPYCAGEEKETIQTLTHVYQ